jgi:chitodextrinase
MTPARRASLFLVPLVALALLVPAGSAAASPRTLEGVVRFAHGDAYAGGSAQGSGVWEYSLVTSSGTYRLAFGGAGGKGPATFLNGTHVRVTGNLVGQTLAVGGNAADAQVQTQVVAAPSAKRVALLLVNFVLKNTEPWTLAQAAGVLFTNTNSVANYFAEESYGQLSMTGDVYGYYTIDYDINTCDYNGLASKANAAASAAGVNLGNYTNVQYAFPSLPCGWSGLAYLPGTQTWLNNALTLGVSAHELSHNFGVHHASTVNCVESGVRVAISANLANCSFSEYGDPFSVMGNAGAARHTHSQQLATLGWASGSALVTATTSGNYTLGAAEDAASAVKALRVSRGDGTYLYFELREPWGTQFDNFSPSDPVVNGVSVRYSNDWNTIVQSKLIDTTPATSTWSDAALGVGASFWDPVSGVTVTTVSLGGGSAVVNLSWGADTTPPTQPGNLNATSTGATTARLSWTASTDGGGVAGYRVSRDGALRATVTGTTYDDTGLAGGTTYQYSVVAFDAAGNVSTPATKSWTQPIADTTKPSAPTNFHTTTLSKAKASFAWTAATDNVGVAGYRIYRNGGLVATTTALTWTDSRQRLATTYYVVAFDAAGNVSVASNSVVVPKK